MSIVGTVPTAEERQTSLGDTKIAPLDTCKFIDDLLSIVNESTTSKAVSYTHLTLPTIYSV